MAFSSSLLYIDRGNYNNDVTENVFASHRYGISSDTFATIEGAEYFPDFLGSDSEEVKINDRMEVIDSTNTRQVYILSSLSPLTLVIDPSAMGAEIITHTTLWGGVFNPAIAGGDITIYKIGRNVIAHFSDLSSTGNAAATMNATVNLPDNLHPENALGEQVRPIQVTDSGTTKTGYIVVSATDGSMTISNGITTTNFTGAGVTGFDDFYISWIANVPG